ncbi:MAG: DUF493 domain-containing protein [Arcobacteraceae bacterium]|jgi:putative lipoic acid-binding regulatory protein|nr:DUF493 domain-containing protein [Arcobacteraceae bacterium]
MTNNVSNQKLELNYPCSWEYRLIACSKQEALEAIKECIKKEYKLTKSNKSKSGKYESFIVELLVHNEDERYELFRLLKEHKNIKMVL